jgi:hypothetical protein
MYSDRLFILLIRFLVSVPLQMGLRAITERPAAANSVLEGVIPLQRVSAGTVKSGGVDLLVGSW